MPAALAATDRQHCGKFIQGTIHQILTNLTKFYRTYDKNTLTCFLLGHSVCGTETNS